MKAFIFGLLLFFAGCSVLKVNKTETLLTMKPDNPGDEAAEDMVFIKGGCFEMGDISGDGASDEKPAHEVCVDDFHMGEHEVTVGEFNKFVNDTDYRTEAEKGMGCQHWTGNGWKKEIKSWRNPGFSQNDRQPAVCISWNDAVAFTEWLSGRTGKNYRLPTEAEWEYAARSGGKQEKWAGVNSESMLDQYAWYNRNSERESHPVKQKMPNGLGLYDMTGNVWEWCGDWYDKNYYKKSPRDNPEGPDKGIMRVLRGGSWEHGPWAVRISNRVWNAPFYQHDIYGFRLSMSPSTH